MKAKYMLLGMLFLSISGNISCKKMAKEPDNQLFINGLDRSSSVVVLVAEGTPSVTPITVSSVYKVSNQVVANIKPAPELIPSYNTLNNTDYPILPADSYELSGTKVTITAGSALSSTINLEMVSLKNIKRGIIYILPLKISSSADGVPVMPALQTVYYLVGIGVSGNAASTNKNHFTAPAFSGDTLRNMNAVTYQARIYGFEFVGPAGIMGTDHGAPPGMEIRLGDYGQPNNAFALSAASFANTDQGSITPKFLNTRTWYSLACVLDNGTFKVYLDGVLVKSGPYTETVDLTVKDFTIGFCFDDSYNLNAWLNECRVWSRALSQDEIQQNSCEVDPKSPGLEAYWKFNEGVGNTIHDLTGHGHDATAKNDVVWVNGQICQ